MYANGTKDAYAMLWARGDSTNNISSVIAYAPCSVVTVDWCDEISGQCWENWSEEPKYYDKDSEWNINENGVK